MIEELLRQEGFAELLPEIASGISLVGKIALGFSLVVFTAAFLILIGILVYEGWWNLAGAPRAPRWLLKRYNRVHQDTWLSYLTRLALQDLAEWHHKGYDLNESAFWIYFADSRAYRELSLRTENTPALWLRGQALIVRLFESGGTDVPQKYLAPEEIEEWKTHERI